MPLKIVAKACPFNTKNCYGETLAPGSFTEFLRFNQSVLMKAMHKPIVGRWNHLFQANDGLYCQGILNDPKIERLVRNGELSQLSISYTDMDTLEAIMHARDPQERLMHRMFDSREGRRFYMARKGRPGYAPIVVERADLDEISLVNKGAFSGTSLHWEAI